MQNITKNDVSGDKVVLDYNALKETATTAVRHSLQEIRRYTDQLSQPNITNTKLHLNSMWLAEEAERLAVAADTLAALNEVPTRPAVEFFNWKEQDNE